MKKLIFILLMFISSSDLLAQGFYNHQWLLGSYLFFQDPKGRIVFDSSSYTHVPEFRKMVFNGTEATICDAQGNFLMSSNGVWIANANNDTMMNGSNLAPSMYTSSWPFGLPMGGGAVFLNSTLDSNKYFLIHKTKTGQFAIDETIVYVTTIDISFDFGKGAVISKNDTLLLDTLSWGITACKHANGRDWWIICMNDGNPSLYTFLLTPNGIDTSFIQPLNFNANTYGNVSQLVFSSDGTKFFSCTPVNQGINGSVLLTKFDRCTGTFTNTTSILVSPNAFLLGLAFSPSGKFAYACSSTSIYQIDTDSLTVDTVANYDGFISPVGSTCCATSFWNMYLAANGKIYITSGSGVQHLHEMNYPDSAGLACDVQQHAINLGYAQLRAVPNHPNYNLGPVVGSVCDSLSLGLPEPAHDFRFNISPNPVADGNVQIVYLLPQNKQGEFEVYDITGQLVYKMNLPPWSTLQYIHLPELSNGVYTCVIKSGFERVGKKLVVMR